MDLSPDTERMSQHEIREALAERETMVPCPACPACYSDDADVPALCALCDGVGSVPVSVRRSFPPPPAP
jgi:hypothetical protein